MIEAGLEIGKFYVRRKRHTPGRPSNHDLVKIIGLINPETYEYTVGYRFYSDKGFPFGQCGESNLHIVYEEEKHLGEISAHRGMGRSGDLVSEATRADFADGFLECLRIDPSTCVDVKRFVPCASPDFRVILGGLYLNSMGLPVLIDAIKHEEGDHLVFRSQHRSYNEKGFYRKKERTMQDLAFQCIGNVLNPFTVSSSFNGS